MDGYIVKSNRETGDGRCDIYIKPLSIFDKAVIIEMKVCDKPKETLGFPKAARVNTLGPCWGILGAPRTSQAFLTAPGMGGGGEDRHSWRWLPHQGPKSTVVMRRLSAL